MSSVQYSPWSNARGLQDEIKQVFDRFLGDEGDQSNVVTSQWVPRVDIREDSDRFVILADIPGVDPKDIEIHMDKGILTLRGERQAEKKDENGRPLVSELTELDAGQVLRALAARLPEPFADQPVDEGTR